MGRLTVTAFRARPSTHYLALTALHSLPRTHYLALTTSHSCTQYLALGEYLVHRLGARRAHGAAGLAARLASVVQLPALAEALLAGVGVGHRFRRHRGFWSDVANDGIGYTLPLGGTRGYETCVMHTRGGILVLSGLSWL